MMTIIIELKALFYLLYAVPSHPNVVVVYRWEVLKKVRYGVPLVAWE